MGVTAADQTVFDVPFFIGVPPLGDRFLYSVAEVDIRDALLVFLEESADVEADGDIGELSEVVYQFVGHALY